MSKLPENGSVSPLTNTASYNTPPPLSSTTSSMSPSSTISSLTNATFFTTNEDKSLPNGQSQPPNGQLQPPNTQPQPPQIGPTNPKIMSSLLELKINETKTVDKKLFERIHNATTKKFHGILAARLDNEPIKVEHMIFLDETKTVPLLKVIFTNTYKNPNLSIDTDVANAKADAKEAARATAEKSPAPAPATNGASPAPAANGASPAPAANGEQGTEEQADAAKESDEGDEFDYPPSISSESDSDDDDNEYKENEKEAAEKEAVEKEAAKKAEAERLKLEKRQNLAERLKAKAAEKAAAEKAAAEAERLKAEEAAAKEAAAKEAAAKEAAAKEAAAKEAERLKSEAADAKKAAAEAEQVNINDNMTDTNTKQHSFTYSSNSAYSESDLGDLMGKDGVLASRKNDILPSNQNEEKGKGKGKNKKKGTKGNAPPSGATGFTKTKQLETIGLVIRNLQGQKSEQKQAQQKIEKIIKWLIARQMQVTRYQKELKQIFKNKKGSINNVDDSVSISSGFSSIKSTDDDETKNFKENFKAAAQEIEAINAILVKRRVYLKGKLSDPKYFKDFPNEKKQLDQLMDKNHILKLPDEPIKQRGGDGDNDNTTSGNNPNPVDRALAQLNTLIENIQQQQPSNPIDRALTSLQPIVNSPAATNPNTKTNSIDRALTSLQPIVNFSAATNSNTKTNPIDRALFKLTGLVNQMQQPSPPFQSSSSSLGREVAIGLGRGVGGAILLPFLVAGAPIYVPYQAWLIIQKNPNASFNEILNIVNKEIPDQMQMQSNKTLNNGWQLSNVATKLLTYWGTGVSGLVGLVIAGVASPFMFVKWGLDKIKAPAFLSSLQQSLSDYKTRINLLKGAKVLGVGLGAVALSPFIGLAVATEGLVAYVNPNVKAYLDNNPTVVTKIRQDLEEWAKKPETQSKLSALTPFSKNDWPDEIKNDPYAISVIAPTKMLGELIALPFLVAGSPVYVAKQTWTEWNKNNTNLSNILEEIKKTMIKDSGFSNSAATFFTGVGAGLIAIPVGAVAVGAGAAALATSPIWGPVVYFYSNGEKPKFNDWYQSLKNGFNSLQQALTFPQKQQLATANFKSLLLSSSPNQQPQKQQQQQKQNPIDRALQTLQTMIASSMTTQNPIDRALATLQQLIQSSTQISMINLYPFLIKLKELLETGGVNGNIDTLYHDMSEQTATQKDTDDEEDVGLMTIQMDAEGDKEIITGFLVGDFAYKLKPGHLGKFPFVLDEYPPFSATSSRTLTILSPQKVEPSNWEEESNYKGMPPFEDQSATTIQAIKDHVDRVKYMMDQMVKDIQASMGSSSSSSSAPSTIVPVAPASAPGVVVPTKVQAPAPAAGVVAQTQTPAPGVVALGVAPGVAPGVATPTFNKPLQRRIPEAEDPNEMDVTKEANNVKKEEPKDSPETEVKILKISKDLPPFQKGFENGLRNQINAENKIALSKNLRDAIMAGGHVKPGDIGIKDSMGFDWRNLSEKEFTPYQKLLLWMLYGPLIENTKEGEDILNIILTPGEVPTESNEEKSQISDSGVAAPVSPKESHLVKMYNNIKNVLSGFFTKNNDISTYYENWLRNDYA